MSITSLIKLVLVLLQSIIFEKLAWRENIVEASKNIYVILVVKCKVGRCLLKGEIRYDTVVVAASNFMMFLT